MTNSLSGRVVTVDGPIEPDRLSRTLMHEHVTVLLPGSEGGSFLSGGRQDDRRDLAVRALGGLGDSGFGAVVNLSGRSNMGDTQAWSSLTEISRASGLHIVAGFGFYTERVWPAGFAELDIDGLVKIFVDGASDVWGSGVPAGIFGEVATSLNTITAGEERALRAVAVAQRETGRAIATHASLGTMGLEQIEILRDAGADLEQVVIGHVDLKPELDYLESMLRSGASIAFDTFGKEYFDYILTAAENYEPGNVLKREYYRGDDARIDAFAELVRRGWSRQLILATDMSGREAYMNPRTHGRYGYGYLPERVLPALRARGVGDDVLATVLVDNPARMLTIR